jgi:hypothetical protein
LRDRPYLPRDARRAADILESIADPDAELRAALRALVGSRCIVKFKDVGDQRGRIIGLASSYIGADKEECVNLSTFRVELDAGLVILRLGSELSRID